MLHLSFHHLPLYISHAIYILISVEDTKCCLRPCQRAKRRTNISHSVCKSEVHPLIPHIFGSVKIFLSLLWGPRVPYFVSSFVDSTVEQPGQEVYHNIRSCKPDQRPVSSFIKWRIASLVNVRTDDYSGLHEHVINGG